MYEALKEYLKSDTSRGNYKLKGARLGILMYLAEAPDMPHDGDAMLEVIYPNISNQFTKYRAGSQFANHVSRLRKAGYLTGGHRQLQITELGLSYLDSQYV